MKPQDFESFRSEEITDLNTARLALRWALDRIRALQDEKTDLKGALQEKAGKVVYMESRVRERETELKSLDSRIQAEIRTHRDRLEAEYQKELKTLEGREGLVALRRSELEGEFRAKESKLLEGFQERLVEFEAERQKAAVEMGEMRRECLALQDKLVSEHETRLRERQALLAAEFAQRGETVEKEAALLQGELRRRTEEVRQQKAVLDWQKASWAKQTEEEAQTLRDQRAALKSQLTAKDEELRKLETQGQELQARIETLKAEAAPREKEIADLRALFQSAQSVVDSLQAEKRELLGQFRGFQQELAGRQAAFEASLEEEKASGAKGLEEQARSFAEALQRKDSDLKALEGSLQEMKAERHRTLQETAEERERYELKLSELGRRLDDAKGEETSRWRKVLDREKGIWESHVRLIETEYGHQLKVKDDRIGSLEEARLKAERAAQEAVDGAKEREAFFGRELLAEQRKLDHLKMELVARFHKGLEQAQTSFRINNDALSAEVGRLASALQQVEGRHAQALAELENRHQEAMEALQKSSRMVREPVAERQAVELLQKKIEELQHSLTQAVQARLAAERQLEQARSVGQEVVNRATIVEGQRKDLESRLEAERGMRLEAQMDQAHLRAESEAKKEREQVLQKEIESLKAELELQTKDLAERIEAERSGRQKAEKLYVETRADLGLVERSFDRVEGDLLVAQRIAQAPPAAAPAASTVESPSPWRIPWRTLLNIGVALALAGAAAGGSRLLYSKLQHRPIFRTHVLVHSHPSALAWEGDRLFVADWIAQALDEYVYRDGTLEFQRSHAFPGVHLSGVAATPDKVFVADPWKGEVYVHKRDASLTRVSTMSLPGEKLQALYADGRYLWGLDKEAGALFQHALDSDLTPVQAYPVQSGQNQLYLNGDHFWTLNTTTRYFFKHRRDPPLDVLGAYQLPHSPELNAGPQPLSTFAWWKGSLWLARDGKNVLVECAAHCFKK